jgi:hypothetical protein
MNKKFSKAWIAAVNKVSAKLDLLRDLQTDAQYKFEHMHLREQEDPPGRLLKKVVDLDLLNFDEKLQASAAELEEKYHPASEEDKKDKKKDKKG